MSDRLFLSITGDYPNIGDAFIRREAVRWVRPVGRAQVYAKAAPEVWIKQVGVTSSDRIRRSGRLGWVFAVIRQKRAVVAFEPGEVLLDIRALPRELMFLVMFVVTKLRGGVILLPPRAVVGGNRVTLFVHALSCRVADIALWRDPNSLRKVAAGQWAPDIGFGGGIRAGAERSKRTTVVVSFRGRRPSPTDTWVAGVTSWAEQHGFRLVTLAQVREDEDRAAELAQRLGGTHFRWIGDDIEHEQRLRTLYDDARLAISDRLHVLIVSSLSGVIPSELASAPTPKVETHFSAIGMSGVSRDTTSMSISDIGLFLDSQLGRGDELDACISDADRRLKEYELTLKTRYAAGE